MNKFCMLNSSIFVVVLSANIDGVLLRVEFDDDKAENVTLNWENLDKACNGINAASAKLYTDIKECALAIM